MANRVRPEGDCFKICVNSAILENIPSKRIISWDYILLPIQLLTPHNGLRHKVFEWFAELPAVLFYFLLAWLFHVNTSLFYFYTMDETLPLIIFWKGLKKVEFTIFLSDSRIPQANRLFL